MTDRGQPRHKGAPDVVGGVRGVPSRGVPSRVMQEALVLVSREGGVALRAGPLDAAQEALLDGKMIDDMRMCPLEAQRLKQ